MRVLLPLHGFIEWNGGIDLVRLMTAALARSAAANRIQLYFALPEPTFSRRVAYTLLRWWRSYRAGIAPSQAGSLDILQQTAGDIAAGHSTYVCRDSATGILEAARMLQADIVFPTMMPLGGHLPPRIGYIFDFQHRHLADYFPPRTRRRRDIRFRRIVADADGIVVNSISVKKDLIEFCPIAEQRVLAMPFTPYAQSWWFDSDPADVMKRYGIDAPYLLVCNHFWKHKDHATALRAFAELQDSELDRHLCLVFSGDPIDHRDPGHFARLLVLSRSLGIANRIKFLGLIPKRDQLALLRGCSLLIQPTLFEGGPGGGSVYEAIGMGVPAVVSDIAINREIDTGEINLFHAGNPTDLAEKIFVMLRSTHSRPSPQELLEIGNARLERLGKTITDFLARAVKQDWV
jgi:glycosyltransferase involved in cell wall biosynthesis